MDKRGGGIKIFLRNIFLSQCRKTSQGNPLLFHSFHVSKKLRNKKKWWGGINRFCRRFFVSWCQIFRRATLLCFVECFRNLPERKSFGRKRGSIKIIRRIVFLSQCRKISWGKLVEQGLSNFPVAKNFVDKRGGIKIFRRKIFLSQCRIFFQGHPVEQCFRKFPVAKKFRERKGEYQDYPSTNFSLTVTKNFVGQTC